MYYVIYIYRAGFTHTRRFSYSQAAYVDRFCRRLERCGFKWSIAYEFPLYLQPS